jgi:hypothetical protein
MADPGSVGDYFNQIAEEIRKKSEERKAQAIAAGELQPDGSFAPMPKYDGYTSYLNPDGTLPDTMKLGVTSNLGDLQTKLDGITLDTRGLDKFRTEALRDPAIQSAWAKMASNKQGLEESAARGIAAQQSAGSQAQARSALAMRGGLSGGSRERLASQGMTDQLMAGQKVGAEGRMARANIALQDEQKRMQALSQLPGMEIQALDPAFKELSAWQTMAQNEQANQMTADKYNLENVFQDKRAKEEDEFRKYQEEMKKYAADRTGRAIENSGKS